MTGADIEAVIAAQAALIAALDTGDVVAIEQRTAALAQLLTTLRGAGAMTAIRRDRVDHALRQTDAARTRVNHLADRTRQRLDRLAARGGGGSLAFYTSAGRFAG